MAVSKITRKIRQSARGRGYKKVSDILLTKMLLLSVYTRMTIDVRRMVMELL